MRRSRGSKLALLSLITLANTVSAIAQSAVSTDQGEARSEERTLAVFLDHSQPDDGTFELHYAFARSFDRSLPTVFVIADGQQFYVRARRMETIQQSIFGDGFNVLGILGRGANDELVAHVREADGTTDWVKAHRYLKAEQWVDDIEAVRSSAHSKDV